MAHCLAGQRPRDRGTWSLLLLPDPERWTSVPLLVKILKLIISELSSVTEANAARQAAPAEWSQGARPPWRLGWQPGPGLADRRLAVRVPDGPG